MNIQSAIKYSKFLAVFVILLSGNLAFSKILTVSNNNNISAQYTSVSAAVTAAAAGDTIYIHGSKTAYGDVTISKRLVIMGPGYVPSNPTDLTVKLGTLTLDSVISVSGVSGSYISGLYMDYFNFSSHYPSGTIVSNFTFKRNQVGSYFYLGYSANVFHNCNILENLIYYLNVNTVNFATSTNIVIKNNIIYSIQGTCGSSTFTNNVLYNIPTFSATTVSNCIFVSPVTTNGSINTTFNNNLFSSTITFTPGTGNTYNSSINNVDPKFAGGLATSYLSISNYQLGAGSAGITAGTDGKDLGVYGGTSFVWGGSPAVPEVYLFQLKPDYVQDNGTLNLTIKVKNQ
jgi:hypothetical protein